MIIEKVGDMLSSGADILCHQTNFHGVMGGGIAYAISKRLSPEEYQKYVDYCNSWRHDQSGILGTVQLLSLPTGQTICNCFCQNDWPDADNSLTNYNAMRDCLHITERWARGNNLTVALPGYMGCGIANGDWSRVRKIIDDIFAQSPVQLTIWYLDRKGTATRR